MERLKKYLQTRIEYELTGDVTLVVELNKHADYFIEANKPKDFSPFNPNNDLIKAEAEFESMTAALEENGIHGASELTVYAYYSRILFFERKAKKNS